MNPIPTPVIPNPCTAAPAPFAAMPAPGPRVLIVDDHALLRVGLRALLQAEDDTIDMLEAACLQDAIECIGEEPVDLVLLDLNMTDCRGLQGLKRFRELFPEAHVVVLSATQDEFVVRQAQALGATAYLAKSQQPTETARTVVALLRSIRGEAGGTAVAGFPRSPRSSTYDRVAELGNKHLEILDHVLFGCSNLEISKATGLSLGTVKNYVSTILLALDVKSRSHLISLFR